MVFADPPYNLRIKGKVRGRGRVGHAEFAFASGEMSETEFRIFLGACLSEAERNSRDGSVHFVCMDWRHVRDLIEVAGTVYAHMLNLVVWNKTNPGQGGFYRSGYEHIGVFTKGNAAHQNNVELGKHGRNRSNVWTYPGVSSFGVGRDDLLAIHPTCKPVSLVADAMRDCTSKGDIVLDPFLGSGTTLMAAERVGRRACGIEYEPRFVDVAIRRWQAFTKKDAVLDGGGRTFEEISEERSAAAARAEPSRPPDVDASKVENDESGGDWVALCDEVHVTPGGR